MTSYAHGGQLELVGDEPKNSATAKSTSTTPSGEEEIKWVVVAKTMGLMSAQIMANRLQSDGIRAWAWQEGAGRALGLTVGILGEGRVLVPEENEAEARAILEKAEQAYIDEDD